VTIPPHQLTSAKGCYAIIEKALSFLSSENGKPGGNHLSLRKNWDMFKLQLLRSDCHLFYATKRQELIAKRKNNGC